MSEFDQPVQIRTAGISQPGLRRRIQESLFASSATTFAGQGANTIANLLLAAILGPADFGAISIATLVITAFVITRNAFVFQTLIQRVDRVQDAADQMALLAIGLGGVLAIAIWLAAPAVSSFFHTPDSTGVLRLLGAGFLIESIGSVPAALLEKELLFRRKLWLELAEPVLAAVVAVGLALLGLGPSAVGWGQLIGNTVWTVGLYVIADYRPRPRRDLALLRELVRYGRYVFAGSLMIFLFTNLDNASVARLLGARALGYYAFAFLLAYFPANVFTRGIVARVVLPVYAKLQFQPDAQAQALLTTLRYVGYYAALFCAGTILLGPTVLNTLYGAKWAPATTALQVLAVYAFAHSYFLVAQRLCNGTGRARAFWVIAVLQLAVVLPFLVLAPLRYGILGTSVLFTASKVITTMVAIAVMVRFTGLSLWRLVSQIVRPLGLALIAGLAALLASVVVPDMRRWTLTALELAIFVVAYGSMCLLTDRPLLTEVSSFIGSYRRRRLTAVTDSGKGNEPDPSLREKEIGE